MSNAQNKEVVKVLNNYFNSNISNIIVKKYDPYGEQKAIIKLKEKYDKIYKKIKKTEFTGELEYQRAYKAYSRKHIIKKKDTTYTQYVDNINERFRNDGVEPTEEILKMYLMKYYERKYNKEYEYEIYHLTFGLVKKFHSINFFEKVDTIKVGDIIYAKYSLMRVNKVCKNYYKCDVLKENRTAAQIFEDNRDSIEYEVNGFIRYADIYKYDMTNIQIQDTRKIKTTEPYYFKLLNIPEIMRNNDLQLVFHNTDY